MQMWMTLVLAVQLLSALAMIGLVLIQHGKGADMGASFGSGASGSLFGASGSANFLSRSTAACASIFFVCTLVLAYIGSGGQRSESRSVLDRPAASEPATGAIPGAAAIPAAGASAAAASATTRSASSAAAPAPAAAGIPAPIAAPSPASAPATPGK